LRGKDQITRNSQHTSRFARCRITVNRTS
jgi:hypothetical protein